VISLREVEAGNIHASVYHFDHHVNLLRSLSEGADNLCSTVVNIDSFENTVEFGASSALALHLLNL
jgi:hypothetical protein